MTGHPEVAGLPAIELSIDRGDRELAAIDAAPAQGVIDEAGWFAAVQALLVPAYLTGDNPRAQSGHSGDEAHVPPHRRLDLVGHLMRHCVGIRLNVGIYNEARGGVRCDEAIAAAGYRMSGRVEVAKPGDPRVVRRAFWIDRDE